MVAEAREDVRWAEPLGNQQAAAEPHIDAIVLGRLSAVHGCAMRGEGQRGSEAAGPGASR